jgi:hypothetical protein
MDGARGVVYTSDFTSIFHAKVNRVGGRIRLVRYGTVRYGTTTGPFIDPQCGRGARDSHELFEFLRIF